MENSQIFNYHTHTYRCGHAAKIADEEYVKAAIQSGFKILGFSDHMPYIESSKPTDRMEYAQKADYIASINSLKQKYQDKIDIKLGFECEYFPEHINQIKDLQKESEYLILGQHYPDIYAKVDYCHNPGDRDYYLNYCNLVCEGMKSKMFIYLAHPDYFCGSIKEFDETCEQIAKKIAYTAAETNTPLELNIKLRDRKPQQYKDGMHIMYPFYQFWKVALSYPIKCVYGFDAHDPDQLLRMDNYTKCDEILKELKPNFIKDALF